MASNHDFSWWPGYSHEAYEKTLDHFAEFANLFFFDPRGTGQSTIPLDENDYRPEAYVDDAKALLDYFSIKKAIILAPLMAV